MSLSKQIYLYSIDTSYLYEEKEEIIHNRLLKLYELRKILNNKNITDKNIIENDYPFWKTNINKLIAQEKEELTILLNERKEDHTPRILNENKLKDKSIITLFDSVLTRALNLKEGELTTELFILNVYFFQVFENMVKDGFIYQGEKYVFFSASAGQIRTKRAVFIKESSYNKIKNKIMCGLSVEDINSKGGINPNKFLAYLALCNSATDTWENFDIDKSIVVDDFETNIYSQVDYINEIDYSITRKEMEVNVPHTDGCGMMLEEKTRMVRLPWVKGLMITFPFDKFIKEKNGNKKIYDIYGKEYDILEDNIKYIFTKSQFKLWKYYSSWDEYKKYFKLYQCEAAFCNIEENYIPNSTINYQMLQTLSDMTDEEIDKLVKKTNQEILKIGNDFQTTMRLLGATNYNSNPNYFQKSLMLYPELFRDTYHKEILKQTQKSYIKKAKGGKLAVDGKYQFIAPDLYAFCEFLFLDDNDPKGLLADGEVYNSLLKDKKEVACLRSPHLYREWAIRTNKRNEELNKWFGVTKCLYTSCHDLISKFLMFDVDGDKALIVQDKVLINVAKRNMKNIVPLYYELRKAKGGFINSEELYEGMIHAYTGGNIGPISNNITKVWNSENIGQEQLNVVAWLCMYNNAVIDYAKTLWLPSPPKEKSDIIKKYTKNNVPSFFKYAKDKEDHQIEKINNSTMNRISSKIYDGKIQYSKSIGKMDYRMLMNKESNFTINEIPIIEAYNYYTSRWYFMYHTDDNYVDDEYIWAFKNIRDELLKLGEKDFVINTLIAYCYTVKKYSNKKLLWACFGKEITENLERNLKEDNRKICPVCGKRFTPKRGEQDIYCSNECYCSNKIFTKIEKMCWVENPKVVVLQ